VFRKDTPGDALYVLLSGEVRVTGEGMETTIQPGDYFGEMSLLRNSTHTKDVRALKDSELLVLPAESFRRLLAASPDLMTLIQKRLRQREQEFDRIPTDAPS
jgi:CRP-like cAMP-binding protein